MIPSDNHHVTKLYAPFSHTHTPVLKYDDDDDEKMER